MERPGNFISPLDIYFELCETLERLGVVLRLQDEDFLQYKRINGLLSVSNGEALLVELHYNRGPF